MLVETEYLEQERLPIQEKFYLVKNILSVYQETLGEIVVCHGQVGCICPFREHGQIFFLKKTF